MAALGRLVAVQEGASTSTYLRLDSALSPALRVEKGRQTALASANRNSDFLKVTVDDMMQLVWERC